MKNMKKIIYVLILSLVVVSGLVFTFGQFAFGSSANRETKNEIKPSPKPLSITEKKARLDERKKWEASPDGIKHKEWEVSAAGKKVHTGAAKIRKSIRDYTNMEGVVTSVSLPPGSRLGFGVMVRINGDDYILAFGPEKSGKSILNFNNEFELLRSLKVNDKIIIRSHSVSYAPKYSYPIVAGDYVERDRKVIYKRAPRKGGC